MVRVEAVPAAAQAREAAAGVVARAAAAAVADHKVAVAANKVAVNPVVATASQTWTSGRISW